ncbi:MAG: CHASE2 domain-containing protein, partial [Candidatus Poribacteria bacterium]|nr:CHASE2 domain-containing protein [Candidatus Poribacteria bacterium]
MIRWVVVFLALGYVAELFGVFDMLEWRTYDLRVQLRAKRPAPSSDQLALVTSNARSEELLGALPWSPAIYANVVAALEDAGCEGALFVFYFTRDEPQGTSWSYLALPLYLIRNWTSVVRQARGEIPWVGGQTPVPFDILDARPLPTQSFSSITRTPEDGVFRHSQAKVIYGVQAAERASIETLFAAAIRRVSPDALNLPLDREGRLLIPRIASDIPTVTYADVLSGDVGSLSGKWVVLGIEPRTDQEYLITPFGKRTALELRASVIHAILTDDYIRPRTWMTNVVVFGVWGLSFIGAAFFLGNRLWSMWGIAAFGVAAVIVHGAVAVGVFLFADTWLPMVSVVIALALTALAWALGVDAARLRLAERRALGAEREAAFGVMSAQVRHEIRNLLNSIRSPAEMVRRNFERGDPLGMKERPDEICAEMDVVIDRVSQLSDMVENELSFFQQGSFKYEPSDLWEVALDAARVQQTEIESAKVKLNTNAPDERGFVSCDATKMRVVFVNLIRNAVQAMNEGGILSLE